MKYNKGIAPILITLIIIGLFATAGIFVYQYGFPTSKAERCYKKIGNLSGVGAYMPNPAAYFCKCMGGNLSIEKSPEGEKGLCKIGSETYEEWEYFRKMNP